MRTHGGLFCHCTACLSRARRATGTAVEVLLDCSVCCCASTFCCAFSASIFCCAFFAFFFLLCFFCSRDMLLLLLLRCCCYCCCICRPPLSLRPSCPGGLTGISLYFASRFFAGEFVATCVGLWPKSLSDLSCFQDCVHAVYRRHYRSHFLRAPPPPPRIPPPHGLGVMIWECDSSGERGKH